MSDQDAEDAAGDDRLTVTEAASRLGIHEKRLRRLLTRTEYRDRTETGTRTTRTGERQVSLLPASLVNDLDARLRLEAREAPGDENADSGDTDADSDSRPGASAFTPKAGTRTETRQIVLSSFYERLIQEKDTRLAEMSEALAHEREQSRRLGEALAREQALRALPPPEPAETHKPWWMRLFGAKG